MSIKSDVFIFYNFATIQAKVSVLLVLVIKNGIIIMWEWRYLKLGLS